VRFNIQPRDRDRRALYLLAIGLELYVVIDIVIFPVWDRVKDGAAAVTETEVQLQKYRRALVRKGNYNTLIQQVKKNLSDAEGRLIRGDNQSLAAVEFQNIVESAATKAGVGFAQRNVSTAKKRDEYFTEITITLSFDSTPNQLASFLSEIRNAPKFITVRTAQVAPLQTAFEAPKTGEFSKTVRVSLTLAALVAGPAVAQPKG